MRGRRGSKVDGRASRVLGQELRSVGEGRERNIEGQKWGKAEGRASRVLGRKPRSVGEGRERNIERVGRLGLQGRSC